MPKEFVTSATAPTTGFTDRKTASPLAQGIRWGNMLFVSGQGPLDPATREVVSDDIQVQTRQTLTNLQGVLTAAGATFANVVNMRVCLRDTADFPEVQRGLHRIHGRRAGDAHLHRRDAATARA